MTSAMSQKLDNGYTVSNFSSQQCSELAEDAALADDRTAALRESYIFGFRRRQRHASVLE